MNYVYIQCETELWTVGFYDPECTWRPESDHGSKEEAAARVHWLNGGNISTPIKQWEYMCVRGFPDVQLGKHGEVGWELAAVVRNTDKHNTYYFKREIHVRA